MRPNLKVIITEHQIPELIHSNLISTSYRQANFMEVNGELIEEIGIKLQF